ncbi:hypothetical protein ACGC1H_002333 [Rhizoctonia solani]
MSLYCFGESSGDPFIVRGHMSHSNTMPRPVKSSSSDRELSHAQRPIRSRILPNTYRRQRTDARATYIHKYELEIVLWQARRGSRIAPRLLICSVCLESMDSSVWIRPTAFCAHEPRICEPCLGRYVGHAVREEGLTEVVCPDITCKREMDYEDVVLYIRVDMVLLNQYNKLIVQRRLESHPNFFWCTNSECSRGQVHQEGDSSPLVTCEYCGTSSCFTHRVSWHDRLTCEEYNDMIKREGQKHASVEYIEKHTTRCPNPNCKRPIEKITGCDHMTCRRPGGCGHEFCWVCLADYGPIRVQGNHLHNPDCRHYAGFSSNDQLIALAGGILGGVRPRMTARAAGRMVLDAQANLRAGQPSRLSTYPRVTGRQTIIRYDL